MCVAFITRLMSLVVSSHLRNGSDAVQSLIRVSRHERGFEYDELRPVRFRMCRTRAHLAEGVQVSSVLSARHTAHGSQL